MQRKLLGITVLGDFIVSEGVQAVLENLQRTGATAVAINPTVTAAADEATGKFQPPADAGHSPRRFDRSLFGKHALWLRSSPSFHPRGEFYADSPYGPRKTNDLTGALGPRIGEFVDGCVASNIDVYIQIGAAEPTGLRDEDRPRLPDGGLPQGRIADVASLASGEVRAYNRAYVRDLVAAYPSITGFRIDWPEYPCYTPDEVFQDFGPHVEKWADEHGFDFAAIRSGVAKFHEYIAGSLTNEILPPLADRQTGRIALTNWLEEFPAIPQWLQLKSALSLDLISDWQAIMDSLEGPRKQLSVHAFMPPFSQLTGLDFARAAKLADSLSPKFYTMHWCLMVHEWGKWLLAKNPGLDETLLTRALVNLLRIKDEDPIDATLSDFAYPRPDEPHPIGDAAQREKISEVVAEVDGKTKVYPLLHGYGPVDDFARRFRAGCHEQVDGVWVNRYGYLSDEKLATIAREWEKVGRTSESAK
mgnify:CR=1 FL=1